MYTEIKIAQYTGIRIRSTGRGPARTTAQEPGNLMQCAMHCNQPGPRVTESESSSGTADDQPS